MRLIAAALVLVALAGCGVEVPDDVAARATTTTVAPASSTTAPPMSDDEVEQALIDNGYTAEEARCGAEQLRRQLDEDEIREIVEAESVDDIDPALASRFADALGGCVEG